MYIVLFYYFSGIEILSMQATIETDRIKEIFRRVKPFFNEKLGPYTHQRISGEWHFRGLAYVRGEMTYIFGFNLGFFKQKSKNYYDKTGMNILIRTNGINEKLRKQYADFFRKNLTDWYFNESEYTSFRGGEGIELERYKDLSDFNNDDEIIEFHKASILQLHSIYEKIAENPDNIFDDVLRGAFPWHDTIFDICEKVKNPDKKFPT